jgi:LPXTG-motif cell wall-anchored protein
VEDSEELPFTGSHDGYWLLLAGAALVVGVILVVGARRDEG